MEKVDRRVKRTEQLLQQALIDLTLEQGYEAVTIREITERADVGYATFFRHYPDKESLLADVLKGMKDSFIQLLTPYSFTGDPEAGCTVLFKYIQEHATLSRVLLNTTRTLSLIKPIQEVGLPDALKLFQNPRGDSIPLEIAASHLVWSLIILIQWWLENNMPYPPERMGQIAADLIVRPLFKLMGS